MLKFHKSRTFVFQAKVKVHEFFEQEMFLGMGKILTPGRKYWELNIAENSLVQRFLHCDAQCDEGCAAPNHQHVALPSGFAMN